MVSPNDFNYNFLLTNSGNKPLNINEKGYLYVDESEQAPNVERLKTIHQIAEQALKTRLKDFLQLEQAPHDKDFPGLIYRFAETNLISIEQRAEIANDWYTAHYDELLELYDGVEVYAEAHLVCEMAYDPNIPEAIRTKIKPKLIPQGFNGSYLLKDRQGQPIGIFKPREQEFGMPYNPKKAAQVSSGLREGHTPGTSWQREVAAYEIDEGIAGVPMTTEMALLFPAKVEGGQEEFFDLQLGSFQVFVKAHNIEGAQRSFLEKLAPFEVQKIALFDLLTINSDRNLGNMLFQGDLNQPQAGVLIPIDHGLTFQNQFEINASWIKLQQITLPTKPGLRDWILNYNINLSCEKLRGLHIEKQAILNHRVMHAFLVNRMNKGKTIFEIAQECKRKDDTGKSNLEEIVEKTYNTLKANQANTADENVFMVELIKTLE